MELLIAIGSAWMILAVFGLVFVLQVLSPKAGERGRAALEDDEVTLLDENGPNFYGQLSRGHGQVRGNGRLRLTNKRLIFEMWIPRRHLSIACTSIRKIEAPTSYLGKSSGQPLLCVRFRETPRSRIDSAAWLVRDRTSWVRALES